jgi:hypothetical protein
MPRQTNQILLLHLPLNILSLIHLRWYSHLIHDHAAGVVLQGAIKQQQQLMGHVIAVVINRGGSQT